ncbi:MAG: hypothetical protein NTU53_13840 [Planctomycetota bacterium]|nr:hypothetical protein [Planctomycetota bacterium]
MLLCSLAFAASPSTRPSTPHPVIQTLFRFLDALDSADAPALRQHIHVSESSRSQELGRDTLIALITAEKKLDLAATARFPGQPPRFRRGFDLICSPADRDAISAATVDVDESRTARITLPNQARPLRFVRSSTGQWQVVLDLLDSDLDDTQSTPSSVPDRITQLRVDRLIATAAAVDAVAIRTDSGDYPDLLAAESDLLDRLAAAKLDYRKKVDEVLNHRRFNSYKTPFPD